MAEQLNMLCQNGSFALSDDPQHLGQPEVDVPRLTPSSASVLSLTFPAPRATAFSSVSSGWRSLRVNNPKRDEEQHHDGVSDRGDRKHRVVQPTCFPCNKTKSI
jgi:hypothetical protein